MADNDEGGFKFQLPVLGEQPQTKPLELEGIKVPDIAEAVKPVVAQDEDQLVVVWQRTGRCDSMDDPIFGLLNRISGHKDGPPPGACCKDIQVKMPLSEAKAKGLPLVDPKMVR